MCFMINFKGLWSEDAFEIKPCPCAAYDHLEPLIKVITQNAEQEIIG